jgi:OOP family OmpA-OmpF porin
MLRYRVTAPALAVSALLALMAMPAGAADRSPNYWGASDSVVYRNGTGLCWRTSTFTPAEATEECDPDLVPKKPAPPPQVVQAAPPPPPPPPARPAPPPPAPAPVAEKVSLSADVLFDFDKAVVKPQGKTELDQLADKLKAVNLESVITTGHTDSIGSEAYNQKLSERRAEAVKAYLVSKGIAPNRIFTSGKGEKQPVADNKTAEGRAKNRRVEVEVLGTRNK